VDEVRRALGEGLRRPIHLDHGVARIQWDRTTSWVERELVGGSSLHSGEGWREEPSTTRRRSSSGRDRRVRHPAHGEAEGRECATIKAFVRTRV